MHFVQSPFSSLSFLLALAGLSAACSSSPAPIAGTSLPPPTSSPSLLAALPRTAAAPSAATTLLPAAGAAFVCTEVIGLTITAEWYGSGFEQLVEDSRFQARTRPHTFVDQWADASHEAWSAPVTSPCVAHSGAPDRVVLFAANWKLTTEEEWTRVLTAFVATAKQRYPSLRDLELYTVLRGPRNQTCGDPKSVVEPMIDAAIARVASTEPGLVHAGPRLSAEDCSVFEKGGPHFTEEGRKVVARQLAGALR